MQKCNVCHRGCELERGQTGACKARANTDGEIRPINYGHITSLALDPIEKKPLNMFYPGSYIVSAGSFGCNLRCPFCQNHEISYGFGSEYVERRSVISPVELSDIAEEYRHKGNIGVAFTYNEPLVGYEYVIDVSKEIHKRGMKTVLVSNGNVTGEVADLVIPHIDAMNIDLKGFRDDYYKETLGGDRSLVMDFIERAVERSHVELTTLIVPGYNDSEPEIRRLAAWVAGLRGGKGKTEVALHLSRFFPRFKMSDSKPTDVNLIYRLKSVAEEYLDHVFTGNC